MRRSVHVPSALAAALLAIVVVAVTVVAFRRPSEPAADATRQAAPSSELALTPESLSPSLSANGGPSRLPDAIVVQFARPVALTVDDQGRLSDDTQLELEPEAEGTFTVKGPSTLEFRPDDGFEPGTAYVARLVTVDAQGGVLRPSDPDAWKLEFKTPPFQFVTGLLTEYGKADQSATLELTFSGPVDAAQAEDELRLTNSAGERIATRFESVEGRPHVVIARLSGGLVAGTDVMLDVGGGVRLAGRRVTAPRTSSSFKLVEQPLRPTITVRGAHPAEGTNGFFVEIVCDDAAVKEKRWYWDPVTQEGFSDLSLRCRLDAQDVAEKLTFDPPLPFTTAPSGAGLRVFADFRRGSYAMSLQPGVRSSDGGLLRSGFETTLSVPARAPRVSFVGKGRYLPRSQWRSLPFRHLNVDGVEVIVRHVRPENLVFWASSEGETTGSRDSDLIARTTLKVSGKPDELTTTWLDAGALVPATTRGLLEVTLTAGGVTDASRVVLTDMQIVAKRERGAVTAAAGTDGAAAQGGDVRAWVLDAETLRPVTGAQVDLVRPSGQVVATATSGSSGEVVLRVRTPELPQEPPFAIVARKDEDVSYLAFDEVQAEVDDEHVGGEAPDAGVAWRASLFTDRGVYRPGETAHAVAIVRDAAYGPAKEGMPVTLKLVDPRGSVLREAAPALSAAGFATLDIPFGDYATTGRHELQLDVAGRRVATHRFHVEEFVPERMKVEALPRAAEALVGDPVVVAASAKYLFGSVPVDHRVELTCTLEPGDFRPSGVSGFRFGPWQEEGRTPQAVTLGTSSGVLDAEGKAELSCPTTESGSLGGPGRVVTSVAVFEAGGGRATIGQAAVTLHPERHAIGLSSRAKEARGGEPLLVEGVVVDWQGRSSQAVKEVELTLLRLEREYGWWYDEAEGTSTRRNALRAVPEGSVRAKVTNGKFSAELVPSGDAAGYLVRAAAGRARSELHVEGSWNDGWWHEWGEGRVADRTPRPGKPAWLAIAEPKLARVGEDVTIHLDAPHRGRMLLTAEAGRVLASQWKDVEAGPVSWSFELREFHPNVYVTALLIKPPHLESKEGFVPDRAYGVRSIPVEPVEHALSVTLSVPDEVRSGSPLTIGIDVRKDVGKDGKEGPAQVVVAAIDEGILSLTKFQTPDPLAQVFSRQAIGVATYETVGWTLMSQPPPPTGAGSGDDALALGRVQSIRPVALWSGLVDVPKGGKASVTFQVPTYRGRLRIMAIAATPKRMGSAEASVLVRDPLTLQVTLPRFLVEDDMAQVPVFVTNVSGKARKVEVALGAEAVDAGGATRDGDLPAAELVSVTSTTRTLQLSEGESGTALFTLRVKGRAGAVRLTARAQAGELTSHDEIEVPLLPTGPRTRVVRRIEIGEGETSLTSALEGWEPLSERSTIRVTGNPYADAMGHAKHLVQYPYGCLEQTTSSTRPLLALQNLAVDIDPKHLAKGGFEAMVRAGIDRIFSMQVASGGFSYWPGGTDEAYWGTAYATHLLLDAKDAGYALPDARLDKALDWMEDRVTSHFEKGRQHGDWYSENAEPYFHLVLARAGRARPARAEALIPQVPGESESHRAENRFMLQAALYLSGDRRFEKELRAADVTPIQPERRNDWTFYSDRRRRGFMLATRVDLFGRDPQGEALANLVAEALRAMPSPHYTTQELVWCITGLGKFTGTAAHHEGAELVAGGRALTPATPRPGAPASERWWDVPRASERGDVVVRVARKGEGRLYAIVASEGVRKGAVAEAGSHGLSVSRQFVDAAGVPRDVAAHPAGLGELTHVVLTVGNQSRERIANIALVDRIPAGWEIENPRLGRGAALDWLPQEEMWAADHVDVRDDRLEVFGHLEAGESRKVAYSVRAVTAGRFTLPPVEAEAMYDPTLWARELGGTVQVTGPWAPVAQ